MAVKRPPDVPATDAAWWEVHAVRSAAALTLAVGLFVFAPYLLGQRLYLFKDIGADTLNFNYPHWHHLSRYLRTEGWPRWSFGQGMGQNVSAFALGSPFDDLLFLLGDAFPYAIGAVELLKVVLAATFFAAFLRERGRAPFAAIVGGALFAFSGFVVVGSGWYLFSTDAVYAALLLWAVERWRRRGRWGLVAAAVALVGANQPFDLYLFALLTVAYLALRAVEEGTWNARREAARLLELAMVGALGAGMSAVFLFSDVLQIVQSPRVAGSASYVSKLLHAPFFAVADGPQVATAVLRLFSSNTLGVGSRFGGWENYLEAPVFYCGLLALLLVPQLFVSAPRAVRAAYGVLFAGLALAVGFPWLRHAVYLFAGDYYRVLSLFVVLALLYPATDVLDRWRAGQAPHGPTLAGTVVVLLAALFLPYPGVTVASGVQERAALLLVVLAATLAARASRRKAALAVAALSFVDVAASAYETVDLRDAMAADEWRQTAGYHDETLAALAHVRAIDSGFYRVEKNYHSSPAMFPGLNDAQAQDYFGTTSYHPFNQREYVRFLEEMGIVQPAHEQDSRWANGLARSPLLLTWGSVKYYLFRGDRPNSFLQRTYAKIGAAGDVAIYRNEHFLPFGFTYDLWMSADDFRRLPPPQRPMALLRAYVAEDAPADLERHVPVPAAGYSWDEYERDVAARARHTLSLDRFSQNHLSGTIALDRPEMLFFSIPYDTGWRATVDGRPAPIERVNFGFCGLGLTPGQHHVSLDFQPPLLAPGLAVSVMSVAIGAGLRLRRRMVSRARLV